MGLRPAQQTTSPPECSGTGPVGCTHRRSSVLRSLGTGSYVTSCFLIVEIDDYACEVIRSTKYCPASGARVGHLQPFHHLFLHLEGHTVGVALCPAHLQPPLLMERLAVGVPFFAFAERGLRSEEHTSELQSRGHLVCRLLLEKKKTH